MIDDLIVEEIADDGLSEYWRQCTAIAQQMEYPSIFCTGNWLKVVRRNLPANNNPICLAVTSSGCVKGLLPLVGKPNELGGTDLHFLGSDFYPDPMGLISAPADRTACAAALLNYLKTLPGWDRLILDWVLENELLDWGMEGKPVAVEPYKTLQQDFRTMVSAFKRNNRRYLRGKIRKTVDAGGQLVVSRDSSTHKEFLEGLFSLHAKRAAQRKLVSSFTGNRIDNFHRQLIEDNEHVRFYGFRLGRDFMAVFYGFEFADRFFAYQIAHDPVYGELGPGTALLYCAIEDCCERGVSEFNFLQGNEEYKGIWTADSRILYRAVHSRGTWRSNAYGCLEKGKCLLKKGLAKVKNGH